MLTFIQMIYDIFPLGDSALTIDFGNVISPTINDRVRKLADVFSRNPFAGLVEVVPAYSSLTIFYDPVTVRQTCAEFETAFAAVRNKAEKALAQAINSVLSKAERQLTKIPVCYDAEFAIDLEFVAEKKMLTVEQVIRIHTEPVYRVFMIGFLPGFPYLGEVDERLSVGRKSVPRAAVPQGSVGLAGRQTGIYSLESPGGWQIVGKTPLLLFDPKNESPTLLHAGDSVRFYEIDRKTFDEVTINIH